MLGVFCGSWFVCYLLGFEWRAGIELAMKSVGLSFGRSALVFVASLAFQTAYGVLWFSAGNYAMVVRQLKATTILATIALITAMMLASVRLRRFSTTRPLIVLGNLSFGIYLCHMAPIMVLGKVGNALGLERMPVAIIICSVSLSVSATVVVVRRQILPKKRRVSTSV